MGLVRSGHAFGTLKPSRMPCPPLYIRTWEAPKVCSEGTTVSIVSWCASWFASFFWRFGGHLIRSDQASANRRTAQDTPFRVKLTCKCQRHTVQEPPSASNYLMFGNMKVSSQCLRILRSSLTKVYAKRDAATDGHTQPTAPRDVPRLVPQRPSENMRCLSNDISCTPRAYSRNTVAECATVLVAPLTVLDCVRGQGLTGMTEEAQFRVSLPLLLSELHCE